MSVVALPQPESPTYPKHLLKEIMEQPEVLAACLNGRLDAVHKRVLFPELDAFPVPEVIRIAACGSSAHAGMWGGAQIESLAAIPVITDIASETRYRTPVFLKNEIALVISQSGESADTLAVVRHLKEADRRIIALTSTPDSRLAAAADITLLAASGKETAVPATKSLSAQMIYLLMLAVYWARRKETLTAADCAALLEDLLQLPETVAFSLPETKNTARALALKYKNFRHFFFAGRGLNYPLALEGALKFKEITYIHAEGLSLGSIPHGARTLLDESAPVFALALPDRHLPRTIQDLNALKQQGCKIIALCNPGQIPGAGDLWQLPPACGPCSAFLALPALQLFAYEIGMALNRNVDTPRALHKAVTETD